MRRFVQQILCVVLTLPVVGQVPITTSVQYERLFLPVGLLSVPGANGTVWGTEIVIRNESDTEVNIFHNDCSYHCQCRVFIMCQGPTPTQPRTAYRSLTVVDDLPNTGRFLYVERDRVDDVAINARLVNFARMDDNLGTEIPLIREREFRARALWLVNVPVDTTARQHLRIFGIPSAAQGAVRVRVWASDGDVLLGEASVPLTDAKLDGLTRPYEYPHAPDFGQVADLRSFFQIDPRVRRVRIELQPMTFETRFWAFVSATDNTTQHVTLVTPQ